MIPKKIIKDRREYIFEKEYPNFLMYRVAETGVRECFKREEIAAVIETRRRGRPFKIPNTYGREEI